MVSAYGPPDPQGDGYVPEQRAGLATGQRTWRFARQKKPGPWLKPTQRHGAVYDLIPPIAEALQPAGEWNSEQIHAQGRKIRVTLNGVLITDADLDTGKDPAVLKSHPGAARTTGRIGFLGHGALIEFRNIRVKPL